MEKYLQTFLQEFQHLKIQLEEIKSATNNWDDKSCIGGGGFGKVYKAEVSHSKGRSMAAIKRLDPKHGQGTPEFLKEIRTLSDYTHENLISLLGFCCEGSEMILVYELASRESLDKHLSSPDLTWKLRLKICINVAKGLSYLHDPRDTHRRLIHCDVKSSNVLLDDQWKAKVADLGLSVTGSANEQHSVIITLAAGTKCYIDPLYWMTNTLTKESDVYSFGVVLFEVLCGRLCYTHKNGHFQHIVPTWIESYKQKNLNDIIFRNQAIQPLDQSALEIFSDIAYRCLKESREDRPKMARVVTELEVALESQEVSEGKPLFDYEEMVKTAEPRLKYRSKVELQNLVSKGIFLNGGKTWLSVNVKGEHCERISLEECLDSKLSVYHPSNNGDYHKWGLKTHVRTQFLSPGVTYTTNFVFKSIHVGVDIHNLLHFKYKLVGDMKPSISYLAEMREDGWQMCELYQFTSYSSSIDLEIFLDGCDISYDDIVAPFFEFWPLEKVESKDDKQPISDSDADWEKKLPTDYEDIMKWSNDNVQWTTKKEAYTIMCKGFLINDGLTWISLDKNGQKCHMQSVRATNLRKLSKDMLSLPESRFGEALEVNVIYTKIRNTIQSQLVSSQTTYATYLVYRLSEDQSRYKAPIMVWDKISNNTRYVYLVSPQIPIIRPKADQNTESPINRFNKKSLPQQRRDGWMEVQIWEFRTTTTTTEEISMITDIYNGVARGDGIKLIIQGFESRPI